MRYMDEFGESDKLICNVQGNLHPVGMIMAVSCQVSGDTFEELSRQAGNNHVIVEISRRDGGIFAHKIVCDLDILLVDKSEHLSYQAVPIELVRR